MDARQKTPWLLLLAVFVASFSVIHAWSGQSPALWLDTLNDQREARRCVADGSCSLLGQAASIDGLFVAGGWLHLRAFLLALGLSYDGLYLLLQLLDALGIALVTLAATRLGSRTLGAGAAFVLVWGLGRVGPTREAIYNTSPLVFLGALLLLVSVSASRRPGLWPAALTGLLAAVMTDIHTACTPLGVGVVLVALLGPERRVARAFVAASAFAGLAFVMAPLQWIENARFSLTGGPGAQRAAVPLGAALHVMWGDPIARYLLVAAATWGVLAVTRLRVTRQVLDVAMALLSPMLVAFFIGLCHGLSDSGGKYLAPVKPEAAIGVLVPLFAVAGWAETSSRIPDAVRAWTARVAPWALVLGIFLTQRVVTADPLGFPFFTMADVDAFAHFLGVEHGFSRDDVRRRVHAVDPRAIEVALLDEKGAAFSIRADANGADTRSALLLEVLATELPDPLPDGWTVVRRSAGRAAVAVLSESRLDWNRFSLCAGEGADERCIHGEDVSDESPPRLPDRGLLTLRVPALPTGPTTTLFMPRLRDVCGGLIVAVPGGSTVATDHRHAVLVTAADDAAGDVVFQWDQGSRECPANFARPMAPFFVEASSESASAIVAMMNRRER